jgi:hypothetical protein
MRKIVAVVPYQEVDVDVEHIVYCDDGSVLRYNPSSRGWRQIDLPLPQSAADTINPQFGGRT